MPLDHPGAWFLPNPHYPEPPRKSFLARLKAWLRRLLGIKP